MARSRYRSPSGHVEMPANLRSAEPVATLAAIAAAEAHLAGRRHVAVAHARERGLTWDQIGAALGISMQAAHKQYRHVGDHGEIAPPLPLPAETPPRRTHKRST